VVDDHRGRTVSRIRRDLAAEVAEVDTLVAEAARPFPALWPLGAFVATDPLADLTDRPFAEALAEAARWLPIDPSALSKHLLRAWREGHIGVDDLDRARREIGDDGATAAPSEPVSLGASERVLAGIDREVAKLCTAWTAGVIGTREGSTLFAAWRAVVGRDPGTRRLLGRAARRRLAETGADPRLVLLDALSTLEIPSTQARSFLTAHLARLPGWTGYAKWWSRWSPPVATAARIDLVELAAIRLRYVQAAAEQGSDDTPHARAGGSARWTLADAASSALPGLPEPIASTLAVLPGALAIEVSLRALEAAFQRRALGRLAPMSEDASVERAPLAQVLCCIDVRAARLRDELEAIGPYETDGVAGFFGVPLDERASATGPPRSLRPPLVPPVATLASAHCPPPTPAVRLAREGRGAANATVGGGFALVEAAGALGAVELVAYSGAPSLLAAARQVPEAPDPVAEPWPEIDDGTGASLVAALLAPTGIGVTRRPAHLVVLLGHGASSVNNPYASALDCGACGAARGGTNARAAARLANRPGVRNYLAQAGLVLDERTWFVAAEHDTTTGAVRLLDTEGAPPSHRDGLVRLAEDLARAGRQALGSTALRLPGRREGTPLEPEARRRAGDPSEPQPELGLAGAAVLVIGPRRLTARCDLGGRAFLHSYDPDADPDGAVLAGILAGPLVVAQWITAQYLFTAIVSGAGGGADKAALNVVADQVALLAGSLDPASGLPRQAVLNGTDDLHEPLRLLVVVAAEAEQVDRALDAAPPAKALVAGRHVHLVSLDPDGDGWLERRPRGGWRRAGPTAQADLGDVERGERG